MFEARLEKKKKALIVVHFCIFFNFSLSLTFIFFFFSFSHSVLRRLGRDRQREPGRQVLQRGADPRGSLLLLLPDDDGGTVMEEFFF